MSILRNTRTVLSVSKNMDSPEWQCLLANNCVKKKRQHTPLSFVFKIQYPYPEWALWLYHQNIHKYTLNYCESRLLFNNNTSSTPAPTDKGNSGHLCPLFWIYHFFKQSLRWPASVLDAPVGLCRHTQHQPMLLIPFVNASCCVHIVPAYRACVNHLSIQGHWSQ